MKAVKIVQENRKSLLDANTDLDAQRLKEYKKFKLKTQTMLGYRLAY